MSSAARQAHRHPERHASPRSKETVVLGYCTGGQPENAFLMSLLGVYRHDAEHHRYLHRGAEISLESGPRVAEARCQIVDAFARTDCDWLWMVDDDMGFEPDILDRMMEAADPTERPIIGALCFIGGHGSRVRPTLYNFVSADGDMEHVNDYPRDTLVKIGATGAACILVHRSVFARMKARFGVLPDGRENPYPWFQEGGVSKTGGSYGEDTAFFLKCAALGIPLHVHTGIKTEHWKKYPVTEELFLSMRRTSEEAA